MNDSEYIVCPENVTLIGRCHKSEAQDAYVFPYSASGIAFSFEGSLLSVYLSAPEYAPGSEAYVTVWIDGKAFPLCIDHEGWYEICSESEADAPHAVRLLKRSESNVGTVSIHALRVARGFRLFPAPEAVPARRIQVLGDSIACGYGNLWSEGNPAERPTFWEDGTNTYATMTAERFDAALEVIAISGIGAGNPSCTPWPILPAYRDTDPTFDTYIPELVIIELGANDASQKNPADAFIKSGVELIRYVRQQYPESTIFWIYGSIGDAAYTEVVHAAVNAAAAEGIDKLYFLAADPAPEHLTGLAGHPSVAGHRYLSDILSEEITRVLGWKARQ